MAAVRTFRNDPGEEARDLAACRRDLDVLRYRRQTPGVRRGVLVHEKWLRRMQGEGT